MFPESFLLPYLHPDKVYISIHTPADSNSHKFLQIPAPASLPSSLFYINKTAEFIKRYKLFFFDITINT